jgi:hypothetical protein
VSPRIIPEGAGRGLAFAGLNGRQRLYRAEGGAALAVLAGGRNCNAFVAMATARHTLTPQAMNAVRLLFDSPPMARWIVRQGG